MEGGRELKRVSFWKPIGVMLLVAALMWALWGFVGVGLVEAYWRSKLSPDVASGGIPALGQVGDLFGGVNALFAAFAFAGVAVAAYYQHLSWTLLSEDALRAEQRHARESFEPLFFQLLKMPELPLTLMPGPSLQVGDLAPYENHDLGIEDIANRIRSAIVTAPAYAHMLEQSLKAPVNSLLGVYESVYRENENVLGPYWRALYHVFKLIDRAEIDYDLKVEYANIARATLSKDVVFLLTLNCATAHGAEFKPLVEQFGLLKHVHRPPNAEAPDEQIARWCYADTSVMSYEQRKAYWQQHPSDDPRPPRKT